VSSEKRIYAFELTTIMIRMLQLYWLVTYDRHLFNTHNAHYDGSSQLYPLPITIY